MKISTKGIYALEAMIELASRNTACVSIRDIADARNCSVKYLEQIFKQLKKAQLLISIRGKDGGYQIAKDPEEITAKDIILAVEEKLDPVVCLSHTVLAPVFVGHNRCGWVCRNKSTKSLRVRH